MTAHTCAALAHTGKKPAGPVQSLLISVRSMSTSKGTASLRSGDEE
jgi:hypothetical protein